jgi:hypothetical protein
MPEMKRVYNHKTGEEAVMYAVDAREAVRNGRGDWSYHPKGEARPGMPPMVVSDQTLAPGTVVLPDDEKDRIPDGFGREKGGEPIHYQSGETRMLVKPGEGGVAVAIQPYARRATKAEQIAASNDGSEQDATRFNEPRRPAGSARRHGGRPEKNRRRKLPPKSKRTNPRSDPPRSKTPVRCTLPLERGGCFLWQTNFPSSTTR